MNGIRHMHIHDVPGKHSAEHEGYEMVRRQFVPKGEAKNTQVSIYEIPPGKSGYPYHYHMKNEETFYIISGEGLLRTPEGEKKVGAGEIIFFPSGPEGAHKLTNIGTDTLVYIDFDVYHELEACIYPDSGKMGIWGMDINRVYRYDENVDYFDGE